MPELLLIPHNGASVKFNHWQVFKNKEAAQEPEHNSHHLDLPSKLQQWTWLQAPLIGGIKTDIISTLKFERHSVGLPCCFKSNQNYHSRQIQYYQILNTFAMVFKTTVTLSIHPEMGTTGNSLALFNHYLAKSSPRTLEASECKFQVIAGARNVFTWKCFAFTEIITVQNGNKLVTTNTWSEQSCLLYSG